MRIVRRCGWLPALILIGGLWAEEVPTPEARPPLWTGCAADLHSLSICQLDELFRQAEVRCIPHGWLPGQVIQFTNMPCPRVVKHLADSMWVGKHIAPDGYFINQWRHFKALHSHLTVAPSFCDGNPCLLFQYPPCTPLFGPMRDEYREIAPGLFLGRMYRHRPYVRFLGYNYLQLDHGGCVELQTLCETP